MKTISIIIPCRNEERYIEECLNAIYASDISSNICFQVFVVDGMSDDTTRIKVEKLQSDYQNLILLDNHNKLTPFAFNIGILKNLNADYFQIIGARHIISENYLSKCINILENDPNIWCSGGKIINEFTSDISNTISKAMSTSFGMGIGNFRTLNNSGFTDTVTSPMYPKFVFEKIGYFDEELIRNQDDDFNYRILKAGGKIWYENDISLKYYVRGNFKQLKKQFIQYGYWKVYVNQKHKAITTFRQLAPPVFVTYLLLLPLVYLFSIRFGLLASIPVLIYLFLNSFVSFSHGVSFKEKAQLFRTFLILHTSYGWGYLTGMFHFLILKRKPSSNQKELSR